MKFIAYALSILLATSIAAAGAGETIELETTGTLRTTVVKVIDSVGSSTPFTNDQILNRYYRNDISLNNPSVKSVIEGCSYNKIDFVDPGFLLEARINVEAEGRERQEIKDLALADVAGIYLDQFDLVFFCLPPGTYRDSPGENWSGTIDLDKKHQLVNSDRCGDVQLAMNAMGYMMGLRSAKNQIGEDDGIGHMGNQSPTYNKYAMRCFNGANSYKLDWYTGQYLDLNEPILLSQSKWNFSLDGVTQYKGDGSNGDNRFVSVWIENSGGDDYYLGFNHQSGINIDTNGSKNKITIHKKLDGAGPYETSSLVLVKKLGERPSVLSDPIGYFSPPTYTFRVGSSAVTLTSGDRNGGNINVSLEARSLIDSVDIPTLLVDGPQNFYLQYDNSRDYVGDGIVKVLLEHEGESGGTDWYIEIAQEEFKVQLLEKINGPYEEGESTLVTTLEQDEEYEWRVGNNIVTLKMNFVDTNVDSNNVFYPITLSVTDSQTDSPTTSPTAGPTASPTASPTDSPTSSPTAGSTTSPTASPTASPTFSATSVPTLKPTVDCMDNPTKTFEIDLDGEIKTNGSCAWLASKKKAKRKEYCGMKVEVNGNSKKLSAICKDTCGKVGFGQCTPEPTSAPTSSPISNPDLDCNDKSKEFDIDVDGTGTIKTKNCEWVALKKKAKRKEYCKTKVQINGKNKKLHTICKNTCGLVGKGDCAFLNDL